MRLLCVPEDASTPFGPLPAAEAPRSRRIPLANSGFESPSIAPGAESASVPGWEVSAQSGNARVWHAADTGLWNWYMPEGSNVLAVSTQDGDGVRVWQNLSEPLRPDARYELAVWAGMPIHHAQFPWPQVTMALWAGAQRLGVVDVPEPKIHPHHGVWIRNVLTIRTPLQVEPVDQLRVELQIAGVGTADACFDAITLTVCEAKPRLAQ